MRLCDRAPTSSSSPGPWRDLESGEDGGLDVDWGFLRGENWRARERDTENESCEDGM
ncbi:hypothetical protein IF2G_04607 [Cordyceps javanica]|nr:hypothetical protein IF2G_04607 [Cordyceps javanica]